MKQKCKIGDYVIVVVVVVIVMLSGCCMYVLIVMINLFDMLVWCDVVGVVFVGIDFLVVVVEVVVCVMDDVIDL